MALALIRLAVLRGPHGLKGEVKAALTADELELLSGAEQLWLEQSGQAPRKISLRGCRGQGKDLVLSIKGVEDRDQAQALKGCALSIEAKDLPEAPDGTYWVHQIIGYTVADAKRGALGTLKAVVPTGANDCFEVQPQGRDSYLVPVTDQTLRGVDHAARQIQMDLLEGSIPGEIDDQD